MPFNPDAFVGQDAVKLEAFFLIANQEALAAECDGRPEWRETPRIRGAFAPDPTQLLTRHIVPSGHVGMDLPADHPAITVNNVELIQYIGRGQFGWVYIGKVKTTGLTVAVKVLRNIDSKGRTARFATNEAMTGARLKHRNIMGVFDLRPAGAYWIILMELVLGKSLSESTIEVHDLKRLYGSLSDAVLHMGEANIVHRDIKPDNIVVRQSDRSPVIVDLGLSIDVTLFDPDEESISGTPLFMPPEALERIITPAFDAYSLGVTAAVAISGCRPDLSGGFSEIFRQKKSGAFRDALLSILTGTDAEIVSWIMRLTETDPGARGEGLIAGRAWNSTTA